MAHYVNLCGGDTCLKKEMQQIKHPNSHKANIFWKVPIDLAYTLGICGRRHSVSSFPLSPWPAPPPLPDSRAFDLRFAPDVLLLELTLRLRLLLPVLLAVASFLPKLFILILELRGKFKSMARTVRIGAARQLWNSAMARSIALEDEDDDGRAGWDCGYSSGNEDDMGTGNSACVEQGPPGADGVDSFNMCAAFAAALRSAASTAGSGRDEKNLTATSAAAQWWRAQMCASRRRATACSARSSKSGGAAAAAEATEEEAQEAAAASEGTGAALLVDETADEFTLRSALRKRCGGRTAMSSSKQTLGCADMFFKISRGGSCGATSAADRCGAIQIRIRFHRFHFHCNLFH